MAAVSAKNVRCRINGGIHKIDNVTIDDEAGEIDTTNSESGGYGELEDSGIQDATVTLDGNYDVGQSPLANFYPGALLTNLVIFLYGLNAQPKYVFDLFRVIRASVGGQIRGGKVRLKLYGKNHGTFTRPTT